MRRPSVPFFLEPASVGQQDWSKRAIWLGCARKYVSLLNGQTSMPITSLRYFIGLVEEVGHTQTPETYWQHVRSKADQLERHWLERHACPAVPMR